MTTIDFPLSPVAGQEFEAAGTTYIFNGTGWVIQPVDPSGQFYTKPESDARYVNVSGDTMTGLLTMPYMPTVPEHVVNKAYADSLGGLTQATADVRYVNITGDDMTGPLLTLAPTAGGHAANKTYVDAADAAINAAVALKADKTYVDAGDSAANANANNRVIRTGDVMTGNLTVPVVDLSTGALWMRGSATVTRDTSYTCLYDPNNSGAIFLGGTPDPQNYYRNTAHNFGAIAHAAQYAIINATGLTVTGAITASSTIRAGAYMLSPTYYFGDTGYYWNWDGGNVACNGNIYGHAALTINGGVTFQSALTVVGAIWLNGATTYYRGNGGIYLTHDGSNFVLAGGGFYGYNFNSSTTMTANYNGGYANFASISPTTRAWTMGASPTDGVLLFGDTWAGNNSFWIYPGSECRTYTHFGLQSGNGWKNGGGTWADNSDRRIKNIIGDFTAGLAEINMLVPKIFTYKGNDTTGEPPSNVPNIPDENGMPMAAERFPLEAPYLNSMHFQAAVDKTEFVGFIAQDVEPIFPRLVFEREGWIDNKPVTDLKAIDTTPLIYALVNAVKELSARLEAQAGEIAALKVAR